MLADFDTLVVGGGKDEGALFESFEVGITIPSY
jgi:hypothetical protein